VTVLGRRNLTCGISHARKSPAMADPNIFFLPVGEFCRREVVTCAPDDALVAVASVMRQRNISSVVVCEDGAPAGIVTDRDLRNKVIAGGSDPNGLKVREVMNAPLISIGEEDFLFEALYRMSRHGIHRVAVVDREGRLSGIVTDSDILRLQTRSPQQLIRDIENAGTVAELKELHRRIQELVLHLVGTGVATRDLVRMIAHLNDQLLLRLIGLLRNSTFSDLPDGFAFVVLGSEGRQEQTLTTDQDNAIIYADDLNPTEVARIEAFAKELIDQLIAIGVPPCSGGIMASRAEWRRSFSGWTRVLDQWLGNAVPENVLKGSMFFDLRTLAGDLTLEERLREHISARLKQDAAFLVRTAANVLRFNPPLGWFGRFRLEKKGTHRGQLDIKKAGIFALTEGMKVLALEAGILKGGTLERLEALVAAKVLDRQLANDLEASFNFLVFLRLRSQVTAVRAGMAPDNYLALGQLNHMERGRLRLALEEVANFQDVLRLHFQLDLFG
jgi:CBS domain-containing protein